jgi:hypothetical protein
VTSPTPLLAPGDQFHAGIVVDDPAAVMAELSASFGYEWCDQIGGIVSVELPEGEIKIDLRAWYSRSERSEPRIEIVQSIPGSVVWTPAEGSGIHHLGYWVADVAARSAVLEEAGYQLEARGVRPGGIPYWAYLRHPSGIRVELVSTGMRPIMESYFENGTVQS